MRNHPSSIKWLSLEDRQCTQSDDCLGRHTCTNKTNEQRCRTQDKQDVKILPFPKKKSLPFQIVEELYFEVEAATRPRLRACSDLVEIDAQTEQSARRASSGLQRLHTNIHQEDIGDVRRDCPYLKNTFKVVSGKCQCQNLQNCVIINAPSSIHSEF